MVGSRETEVIKKELAQALKENPTLRDINQQRLDKKASGSPKDMASVTKIVKRLFTREDSIKKMLQKLPGVNFTTKVKKGRVPVKPPKFHPKYPPTLLRVNGWDPAKGDLVKQVPLGSFAKVTLETDAPDNYLTRSRGKGTLTCEPAAMVRTRQSLKDGRIPVKLVPLPHMKLRDRQTVTFRLSMPKGEGDNLVASVVIDVVPAQEPKSTPPPTPPSKRKKTEEPEEFLPKLILVYREPREAGDDHVTTWLDMDPTWSGQDVAFVEPDARTDANGNAQDGMVVYVNMDADCYRDFIRRAKTDREIAYIENLYKSSAYLYAMHHYVVMENGERETLLPRLMRGVGELALSLGYNQDVFKE